MCHKTIFYNTYGDGAQDVTERVDTCRPGLMCSAPSVSTYSRTFRFTKLQAHSSPEPAHAMADRKPTPYHPEYHLNVLPPTPRRSKSPSPSRRRESGIYVNGSKVADVDRKRRSTSTRDNIKSTGNDDRYTRGRVVVVPHAPEPPAPRPAFKRSSTMPDFAAVDGKQSTVRRTATSRDIPIGPVRIVEDLGRRASTSQRRPRSPERAGAKASYAADEEREERRRRRAERRASVAAYGSPNLSGASDFTATTMASSAPAAVPARKELRWQDEVEAQIAAQNKRIARRPKPRLHQEVKGILKKDAGDSHNANNVSNHAYEELRDAVARMDIQNSASRREREREDKKYWERLRGRFEDSSERRRSRVYYPNEDVYKYL